MSTPIFAVVSPAQPTVAQFAWVVLAAALLSGGLALAWSAFVRRSRAIRRAGRGLTFLAAAIDLALVVYRNTVAQWSCPIYDNFDTVLLFVVMLGGVLVYLAWLQRTRWHGFPTRASQAGNLCHLPRGGAGGRSAVDLVLLPLMVLMQALAAAVSFQGFRPFEFRAAWRPLHLSSLLIGTLLLAVAALAAVMFLLLDRALRRKQPNAVLGGLPSLERLEALIARTVPWGLLLLTVAIVSGALVLSQMQVGHEGLKRWLKLYPAAAAWGLYAVVLAVRFAPRFRGRPVAWMCIVAFVLLLASHALAQCQPPPT